jgi:hypothetical protein
LWGIPEKIAASPYRFNRIIEVASFDFHDDHHKSTRRINRNWLRDTHIASPLCLAASLSDPDTSFSEQRLRGQHASCYEAGEALDARLLIA